MKMLTLENAKDVLFEQLQKHLLPLKHVETVPLWEAGGRVLAEDIIAAEDAPAFNRSPVDGFAFNSADTVDAAPGNPVTLKIIHTIAAGSPAKEKLLPGTAMKIFTGAPLPPEADCVIKKEETTEIAGGSAVTLKRPVAAGESISVKGEDVSAGEFLFNSGATLSAAHMGVLATLGIDPVTVFVKPQIGIFSTGNELINVQDQLEHGQLRASNLYVLAEIIRQAGGKPVNLGLARDRVEEIVEIYEKARQLALPLVISTGGTASGDFDVIKDAMAQTASTRLSEKVAIRPGAPFVVAVRENQLLVGLSGNPAGAIVATLLLLLPLISRLAGGRKELQRSGGKLTTPIARKGGLRGFFWARNEEREGVMFVTPFENQYCGAIKTHAHSNCIIEIPQGKVTLDTGDYVTIWKLP